MLHLASARHGVVALDPAVFSDPDAATFAVNVDWNHFPHSVENLDPDSAAYIEIVHQQLVAEVLIAATDPEFDLDHPAHAGWFSIVMIRQVIGGSVRTTALNQDVHLTDDPIDQSPNSAQFGFDAVADFNGDGRAEVMVWGQLLGGSAGNSP